MTPTLLLADESLTVQRVVELTFADEGIRVVSVSDGPEAIAASATAKPQVAMVSVSLPHLDGYEVAGRLRAGPAGALPVLLVAGAFDVVDDQRVRESGAAGVLQKPLEPGLVIKRVKELLGMPATGTAAADPPAAPLGRLVTPTERLDFHTAAERDPVEAATPPVAAVPTVSSPPPSAATPDPFTWKDLQTPEASSAPPPPAAETGTAERADASAGFDMLFSRAEADVTAPPTAPWPSEAETTAAPFAAAPPAAPAPSAGGAPPLSSSSGPAEAFAVLLADQHAAASAPAASAAELSDAAVDRLAERVADRLLQGVLGESLRRTVSEVSERLVREEIARIRAAARSRG